MPHVFDMFAPYISARVRGMKSGLMPRSELGALLDKSDLGAMADVLLTSAYEVEMAEAMSTHQGSVAIEDALSRNLVNTFSRLRRLCMGRYSALADIFMTRWDLIAVKSLLRNRHHELDADTGAGSLLPGPSIPVALMRELASQDTMDALLRALAAWNPSLRRGLLDKLGDYQENHDLRVLEQALDERYFVGNVRALSNAHDGDSHFLKELLRMEIDRINLRLLFAPRGPEMSPEDVIALLLPRGTLSEQLSRNIASAPSPERAVALLENTAYADLTEGIAYYAQSGRFSILERQFETAFLRRLQRAVQQQPFGLPILMRYAWLKYNEVINLRMIAQALAVRLPRERVMQEIFYV